MANQHFIDQNGTYFVAIEPIETPAGATVVPAKPGQFYNWNGSAWVEDAAAAATAEQQQQEAARQRAYVAEADPLFFKAQRGEGTMEEWQAKVAEIKARFPYPVA